MNPDEQRALLNLLVQAALADGNKADSERQFIRSLSQQLDDLRAVAGGVLAPVAAPAMVPARAPEL